MMRAIITGITGQDGAYLAQFLLEKEYEVVGCFRRCSTENFWRIEELGIRTHPNLKLVEFELTDLGNAVRLISKEEPDEVYNLAAQSFVGVSFEQPVSTSKITGLGALHLLEAIRMINPKIKFYQASTSEMFGKVQEIPQNEETSFYPRSPYAVAKLFAHWTTINYRESYGIFAASGILFNHESPLRGLEFVTRKITQFVAGYPHHNNVLELGNLDAKRDWGYAKDYVEGMYLMLHHNKPETFVLATGVTSSVRDFVTEAYGHIGIEIIWEGSGVDERGICKETKKLIVRVNPKYFRPTEVELLLGDASKARKDLGWKAKMGLKELVKIMVTEDIKRHKRISTN